MITAEYLPHVTTIDIAGHRWFIRYSLEMPQDGSGQETNVLYDPAERTITAWASITPRECVTFIVAAVCEAWKIELEKIGSRFNIK